MYADCDYIFKQVSDRIGRPRTCRECIHRFRCTHVCYPSYKEGFEEMIERRYLQKDRKAVK